jgi:predicted MPP superfamily phosphohydrolase
MLAAVDSLPVPVALVCCFVLFCAACTGHAALIIPNLNRLYGIPLPRRFLRAVRRLCYLALVAGAVLFFFTLHFPDLLGSLTVPARLPDPAEALTGWRPAYTWLCVVIGMTWLPGITLYRLLWLRPPQHLRTQRVERVDVARELGYKPIGHGRRRQFARLPFNQVFQVDFNECTLHLPRLPAALDGLSILHLTDLHLCGTPDRAFYRWVMDRCREWDPDLIALTGDVVDSIRHHRWIIPLLGRLRWKHAAFAVLGNHDHMHEHSLVRRRLKRIGFRVLGNGWETIEINGVTMTVVGHEGPWFRPAPNLAAAPAEAFRFCLSHTPDNINWARRNAIDLMLAGHNHGGQIRLPVIGSLFVPSVYSRRYDCGTFDEPPTLLHVGRGLAGKEPLRFNCRPEVTKFVLRPAQPAKVEVKQATESAVR